MKGLLEDSDFKIGAIEKPISKNDIMSRVTITIEKGWSAEFDAVGFIGLNTGDTVVICCNWKQYDKEVFEENLPNSIEDRETLLNEFAKVDGQFEAVPEVIFPYEAIRTIEVIGTEKIFS